MPCEAMQRASYNTEITELTERLNKIKPAPTQSIYQIYNPYTNFGGTVSSGGQNH